jgi:uncharacterized protein DUF6011
MTPDQYLQRQTNRGCPADCYCQFCVSDDLDVTAAAHGLNTARLQRIAQESRDAAGSRSPRSGSGSGSAPAKVRRMRLPTDKQLDFIASLFAQRDLGSPQEAQVWASQTYPEWYLPGTKPAKDFDGKRASTLIDALMKLPRRGQAERDAARQAESQRVEAQLEEGRLYAHEADIYRVQRSKQSGRLYALRVLEGGGTDYTPGVVTKLDPEALLSLEAAQAWGRKTGTCCNCYARLTNPLSIELGIGPTCRGKFS